MKLVLVSLILLVVLILGGSWLLVDMAFKHDMKNAEEVCASLGARPNYTYRTHYICVTPEGRVVG